MNYKPAWRAWGATLRPPRNGRYYVGLLAGGRTNHFLGLRDALAARHGIWLNHHWTKRPGRLIPRDVDVVLSAIDFSSHGLSTKTIELAKASGRKWLRTTTGYTECAGDLKAAGFPGDKEPVDLARPIEIPPYPVPEGFTTSTPDAGRVPGRLVELAAEAHQIMLACGMTAATIEAGQLTVRFGKPS